LNVEFVKIDVDECKTISKEAQVTGMPTFQLYRNGKQIDQVVGFSLSGIEDMLKRGGASASNTESKRHE
jgi:thioredoxin 1